MRYVLLLCMTLLGAPLAAQDLYIRNARISTRRLEPEVTGNILIQGGVITGFPKEKPGGYRGPELDAGGRWVIPALTDMHTHSVRQRRGARPAAVHGHRGVARVDLLTGVARFLDLFSPEDSILALRDRQRAARSPAPRFLPPGPASRPPRDIAPSTASRPALSIRPKTPGGK